jgi:erythromycin esterase
VDAGEDAGSGAGADAGERYGLDECVHSAEAPAGWRAVGAGAIACDPATGHASAGSLLVTRPDEASGSLSLSRELELEGRRDQRLTVRVWVFTTEPTAADGVAAWVRAQGPYGETIALDNMSDRPVPLAAGRWTEMTAQIDVPPETERLIGGLIVRRTGSVWIDDLEVVSEPIPVPRAAVVSGRVTTSTGDAARDVVVAISAGGRVLATSKTDGEGRYQLELKEGDVTITAQRLGLGAAMSRATVTGEASVADLSLGPAVEVHVTGIPAATAATYRVLQGQDEVLFVGDGTGAAVLPGDAVEIRAEVEGKPWYRTFRPLASGAELVRLEPLEAWPAGNAATDSSQVVPWPSGSIDKDVGTALEKALGPAEVVGVGEPSHGAHEAFLLRLELTKYLVEERGFTVLALEAGEAEARAVDTFIHGGDGDAKAVTEQLGGWIYRTEEMKAVVEWLRAWNDRAPAARRVRVVGVDIQSVSGVVASLETDAATSRLEGVSAALASLKSALSVRSWWKDAQARKAVDAGVAATRAALKKEARGLTGDVARDLSLRLRRIEQHVAFMKSLVDSPTLRGADDTRDRFMAENVVEAAGKGKGRKKVILWAHNAHVGLWSPYRVPAGKGIRASLGKRYVPIALLFGGGSFQAFDVRPGVKNGFVRVFSVADASPYDVVAPLVASGMGVGFVDLRRLKGPLRTWFTQPHLIRQTGAPFVDEETLTFAGVLAEMYDGVIFVAKVSRAVPLARTPK